MNYDLVISDFDGTLKRRDDTVSERTVRAIREYVSHGGIFGISTGRAYQSILKRLGDTGLSGNYPVMCCQGALTCDSVSGEAIGAFPMPHEAVIEFLARAEKLGLVTQVYTLRDVFVPELNEVNKFYFETNRVTPVSVGNVLKFAETLTEPVYKALCFIEPSDRAKVIGHMQGIEGVKIMASHACLVEAASVLAGKGNGLRRTCERLGIDISRTVALGDEINDVEMLEAAGLGVAVGNAVLEAKRAAKYITSDCDCDGVAEVLEKIVRGQL